MVNKNIRLEKIKGKYQIREYSLYSGRCLKVLHTFDNTYKHHDRELFFNAYRKSYYKEG